MQYRHLFPMLRVLLPFMTGIILSLANQAVTPVPPLIWACLLLLTIGSGFIKPGKIKFVQQWLFGLALSGFLLACGYNSVILHKEILRNDHFSGIQSKGVFIARISEPLQEKEHSYKTILRIIALKKESALVSVTGSVLTYFEKDTLHPPPPEGSLIVLSGIFQDISPPQNPGAFDYRRYMASNNVYHQIYIQNVSYKLLDYPHGFNLFRTAHKVSKSFVKILGENGLEGKEFAVASALIMGQNDMLDNETLQSYSGTGVMHILSVSGLHVGVIFIIINFLLGFMKKKGSQLYLKTTLILLTIWAYAILTGMSPSVMRSAAMFTFISFGNLSNRYVHIINSLSVSALFLLLINPLMISNIGFQLSYIAILGIVFINQPLAELWSPTNRIAGYTWDLVAVSVSAQIATAPLAMFYFHQFPTYFIPANLAAIPLSFLAIYSGVAVLITSVIPLVSNFFGILTNYILLALNAAVRYIEHLPGSTLRIDSIFAPEMLLIYGCIVSFLLLVYLRKKEFLFATLGLVLLLSVCFTLTGLQRQNQQTIVFYSAGRYSAIGFINGKNQVMIADSLLLNDRKACQFQLSGTASVYGIKKADSIAMDTLAYVGSHKSKRNMPLFIIGDHILFCNLRIAVVDSIDKIKTPTCSKLKVDYLLIRHNPKLKIRNLLDRYEPGMVIFDGSNSVYKTGKWMDECRQMGQKAYSTANSGALVIEL